MGKSFGSWAKLQWRIQKIKLWDMWAQLLILQTAEQEFIKMNKKMEAIIEAIPDLMFEVSLDGTFYYYSKRHDLLVPPEEFLGKAFFDVLPLEPANAACKLLQRLRIPVFQLGVFLELPLGKFWLVSCLSAPMEQ
jgi:PAS domain-containing protein